MIIIPLLYASRQYLDLILFYRVTGLPQISRVNLMEILDLIIIFFSGFFELSISKTKFGWDVVDQCI